MSMKRIVASFLALVFVVGVLILPALHMARCSENNESHQAEQCPICQLASTPVVTAVACDWPVVRFLPLDLVSFPQSLIPHPILIGSAEGRAPPLA
jgi:hypothetical protein